MTTSQIHRNKTNCPTAHAIVDKNRYAACYFETDTQDFEEKGFHGEWQIFVNFRQTETNPNSYDGEIYWWLKDSQTPKRTRRFPFTKRSKTISGAGENLTKILQELKTIQNTPGQDPSLWLKTWSKLESTAKRHNGFRLRLKTEFRMEEDGLIFLKKPQKLHKPSAEEDSERSVTMLEGEEALTVVRQSFYMIKQCLHVHRHHDHTDDAVTTAHDIKALKQGGNKDLGMALIDDIKISLVDLQRSIYGKYAMLTNVSGMAAYAKSLALSLSRRGWITEEEMKVQHIYVDNVESSIMTSAETIKIGLKEKSARLDAGRNFLLAFLALLSPQILLHRTELEASIGAHGLLFKVISATVPRIEFWIFIIFLYWLWANWNYTAKIKFLLSRTPIWGNSLALLFYNTTPKITRFITFFLHVIFTAMLTAGLATYLMNVGVLKF